MMLDLIIAGLTEVLRPDILVFIGLGVFAGVIIGSIPGFTVTEGVALTLPLTYGMTPIGGLSTIMGVYVGSMTGGLITATLLGIPGTGASIATTFDGYPMASRGESSRALGLGILASFIGGIVGGILLIGVAPILATWALKFGPWEYFSLAVFALTIIASLAGDSLLKGAMAGCLGLFLATVGMDPLLGVQRFTFGSYELEGGFSFIPVLIGLYAFSEVLSHIHDVIADSSYGETAPIRLSQAMPNIVRDLVASKWNLVRSSLIGVFVGVLPAAGGSIANIVSYDQAKRASKHPETFGEGSPDGIIAAESANNALAGGALIPTLAFGMPGDAATAIMLGALMLHGIQPGPMLFATQPRLSYGIIGAYLVANVLVVTLLLLGIRFFTRIHNISNHILFPWVFVFCTIGSFAINHRIFDLWTLFLFGVIGYLMRSTGFPLPPLVLGLILGPMAEKNLRQALMNDPNIGLFVSRPISLALLLLAVASLAHALWPRIRKLLQRQA